MSVVKKFIGDTAIYGLSTIVSRLLNFVLTPVFVRKFPASVYGIFTNVYSWAALVNTFLAFGMETTYFRFLQKFEKGERNRVFNSTFIVTLCTSAVFLSLLFTFAGPIAGWFGQKGIQSISDYQTYVTLMGVTLAVDALAVVPFAKLRSENRPIRYGALKLVNIIVFVCVSLFFILFLPWLLKLYPQYQSYFLWYRENWLGYVFLANLIASSVTLIMLLPEFKAFRLKVDYELLRSMFNYSFPIFVANLSFIINEHLDKVLMPSLLPDGVGERDLGIYGAITKIAVFLSIFVQAFRLGAEPFFFSYAKNQHAKKTYALIMEYFAIFMMLVMMGLSMNIEWLKYFIEGGNAAETAKYWSGLDYIPLILFNYVLLGIYMNLSIWYKLSDQTRYGLYISGIGAIITCVCCYIFIPRWSYIGAIIVTSITYLTMVSLSYYWGQKNYAIPYRLRKIAGHILLGSALVASNYILFDRNVWTGNLMLLLYIGYVAFSERKFLLNIIRS